MFSRDILRHLREVLPEPLLNKSLEKRTNQVEMAKRRFCLRHLESGYQLLQHLLKHAVQSSEQYNGEETRSKEKKERPKISEVLGVISPSRSQ